MGRAGHSGPKTPRKKKAQTAPVLGPRTPARSKETRLSTFQIATHAVRRRINCEELYPSTHLVSLRYFVDSVLPSLPPGIDINAVVARLTKQGCIEKSTGRFSYFPEDPCITLPRKRYTGAKEDAVFQSLGKLGQKIIETGKKVANLSSGILFYTNPTSVPTSDSRDNDTRPDDYGILDTDGTVGATPAWKCIAFVGENKLVFTVAMRHDVSNIHRMWLLPAEIPTEPAQNTMVPTPYLGRRSCSKICIRLHH